MYIYMLCLCIYNCIYICLSIHRHASFCFSFTKILCLDTALVLKILSFFLKHKTGGCSAPSRPMAATVTQHSFLIKICTLFC